jgi:hypothetical protein
MIVFDNKYWSKQEELGGIFRKCPLYQELENNRLPHCGVLVDDAFPLKTFLLKTFSHKSQTYEHKIFNYRLSRARRIVENVSGILASRFRIFHKPISTRIELIKLYVLHVLCITGYE